jgi:arylsulfatase A
VLNNLREKSLSFDRFYVCPVSAPTRAEMLTGRYFLRTGVSSVTRGYENMRTNEVTLAEILKDNGYITGCFGKWHNGGYYLQHPNRQGFDEFTGFCMGHLGYYFDGPFLHNDEEIYSDGYTTDFFTGEALEFIDESKDHPFLCFLSYNVPHSPFQVPPEYFTKYRSKGLDSTLSSIYGMVNNMDHNIGRVIKKLEDENLSDNTIIIFFSDNGPNTRRYNGGMKGIKGSVDEGGLRVPFYISWPGKIRPGSTPQLAQDIDILPSLLGLSGIKYTPPQPLDGVDLSPLISGKASPFDRYIFSRQGNQPVKTCNGSVRNDRFRLVRTAKGTVMFDMVNDPGQTKNLSDKDTATFNKLKTLLAGWEKEMIEGYEPVTTIQAGFAGEKSFVLPVQDATLSGNVKFSSIHPNQSYTKNWNQAGDSVYWTLNIDSPGTFKAELKYGCPASETGSTFTLSSNSGTYTFTIDWPFDSEILPEMDMVKRTESEERTWSWMTIGNIHLQKGSEKIVLQLKDLANREAGIIKALRFTRTK